MKIQITTTAYITRTEDVEAPEGLNEDELREWCEGYAAEPPAVCAQCAGCDSDHNTEVSDMCDVEMWDDEGTTIYEYHEDEANYERYEE